MKDHQEIANEIESHSAWVKVLMEEMAQVIVGQEHLVGRLIVGLLTNGHVLLEGVPGLAKTLAISSLSGCLDAGFSRLQFTPDLLPADLLGTMIYNPKDNTFSPKLGPIFNNLILADEINRAPAKVQSALLEAMQEKQVTIGETTHPLPNPFLVLATQNPIDQEGTYTLPEAQLDRFLLKVQIDYPSKEEENVILQRMATTFQVPETRRVVSLETVAHAKKLVNQIYMDEAIQKYIVNIIHNTRASGDLSKELSSLIRAGSSPRGTINLALAAKASAYMQGRAFVIPQDVKDLAKDVLHHRILLSYEAEAENVSTDSIIDKILEKTLVP